jgi:hypothetical protein
MPVAGAKTAADFLARIFRQPLTLTAPAAL